LDRSSLSEEEKIGPITRDAGIPGPPEIQFFEVHNHLRRAERLAALATRMTGGSTMH